MNKDMKQRLLAIINCGGHPLAAVLFVFGAFVYLSRYVYLFGVRWDAEDDGLPLMFWGLGLFVAVAAVLYILDGRVPVTRAQLEKLKQAVLSPNVPYTGLAWSMAGVAFLGTAIGRRAADIGGTITWVAVLLAIAFGVSAVVVKRIHRTAKRSSES